MTDFDYDAMQKKRIASGDRYRKRGSRSKYCGLPSDHMTHAQWKKKNGEVKMMNLNEPMSWEMFKAMPNDLQKEYVAKLVDRFHCNMKDLGMMFGVKTPTVSSYFKLVGVDMSPFGKGKCGSKQDRAAFNEWAFGGASVEEVDITPQETLETPAVCASSISALDRADSFEATWSGDLDLVKILGTVHQFANGSPIRLHVQAERIK